MLSDEECLVSIAGKYHFADTNTTTHIAKIVGMTSQGYHVILVTDSSGEVLVDNEIVINVSFGNVVSNKTFLEIKPKRFYQIGEELTATGFATKGKTLESTSRVALGSGIQGIYVKDESLLKLLGKQELEHSIKFIECSNSYSVQDSDHDDSITLASVNTNRYLDRIIDHLQNYQNEDIFEIVKINQSTNLLTLWNIALYRTSDSLTQDELDNILSEYLHQYLTSEELHQELPINSVMRYLGYSCLITTNNRLLRKCVSYDYPDDITKMAGKLE